MTEIPKLFAIDRDRVSLVIRRWLEERGAVLSKNGGCWVETGSLHRDLCDWASRAGEQVISLKLFSEGLQLIGFQRKRQNRTRRSGFVLRSQPPVGRPEEVPDVLCRWLNERCAIQPCRLRWEKQGVSKINCWVETSKLAADFADWARSVGEYVVSEKLFSETLHSMGFERLRQSRTRRSGFVGVCLRLKREPRAKSLK